MVKRVEVLIESSEVRLSGISNRSFGIGSDFLYAIRLSMLNVELISKSSGKSRT